MLISEVTDFTSWKEQCNIIVKRMNSEARLPRFKAAGTNNGLFDADQVTQILYINSLYRKWLKLQYVPDNDKDKWNNIGKLRKINGT